MNQNCQQEKNFVQICDGTGTYFSIDKNHFKSILFTDCDGVLTDGCVYYFDADRRARKFNVRDGHAFQLLEDAGVLPIIISGEDDENIRNRARKLDVPFFGGIKNKLEMAQYILNDFGETELIGFIGDDLQDIPLLKYVDVAGCHKDAHSVVKDACLDYANVSPFIGGAGAFRWFAELFISIQPSR